MANFLAVVDPDPTRRAACLAKAEGLLDVLPAPRRGRCASGAFAVVWAAAELAPVSEATSDDGAAVVWGDALATDGAATDAAVVRRSWKSVVPRAPDPWDGFYAAVSYDSTAGLVAGADLFGLFPVYYWSAGEVLLVGSSIASFHAHSSFRPSFNPVGLTAILLTGGLIDGETVWRGVRRLAPGHLLTWSPVSGAREVHQYSVPMAETLADRSFDDHVAMLDESLDRVVARHVRPDDRTGLLLSGGRDSRVVAGLLHRRGLTAHTLTLGEPRDYEVRCATAVAEMLGFPHESAPDPIDDAEEMARRHVRHEQLTNGMANFYTWGMLPLLPWCGNRIQSGYWIEDFIAGTERRLPGTPADGADPFERLLRKATSYGIAPDRLRRLTARETFGSAVDDCVERIRSQFTAPSFDADRRAWKFDMEHRARFHPGSTPWRMSLAAWPGLLALDQSFVRLCASLPMSTLLGRRAQDELLRTRFPALARLPLDRNSNVTEPLLPSAAWRLRRVVVERVPLAQRVERTILRVRGERRRYYRLYDINSPMWRAVRRMAEAGRSRAAEVLDAGELDALLPAPDASIVLRDPIIGSNGLKALLGFMIWCLDHV